MDEDQRQQNKNGSRYATKFSDGSIIANEGPGKGFASYPWILDEYEKALDLSPAESWLLHRMIKHSWESEGQVWISLAKVTREAKISRRTLNGLIKSLLEKGYIDEVGRRPSGDNRAIYDVSGLLVALHWAVLCNPESKHGRSNDVKTMKDFFTKNSPDEFSSFRTPAEVNRWCLQNGFRMSWRVGQAQKWQEERNERSYELECWDCGSPFSAGAANAKYCPTCKDDRRREQWFDFQAAYSDFREAMDDVIKE